MSLLTKDINIIRKVGMEVLTKELGSVGMAYFIKQFDMGTGDYTKNRQDLLQDISSFDEFEDELLKLKSGQIKQL